jgi:hypothetical protein
MAENYSCFVLKGTLPHSADTHDTLVTGGDLATLEIAYIKGHVPEHISDQDALIKWWDSLSEEEKNAIMCDVYEYSQSENERQGREEWHRKKFRTPGWRAGLAATIPTIFAIRWLVYASGAQKWWAIAIFLVGGFLMRLFINLYDRLRGNPRRLPIENKTSK